MKERAKHLVRLYVDMDETVAKFYEKAKCMELFREPGFFRALTPYQNMVDALEFIAMNPELDVAVTVLSAVETVEGQKDKIAWLAEHFKIPMSAHFCPVGVSKAEFIAEKRDMPITKSDFLLDDYSKNLIDWEAHGGTGIKFLNEVNGRGWNGFNFSGHTVHHEETSGEIVNDLLKIMGVEKATS